MGLACLSRWTDSQTTRKLLIQVGLILAFCTVKLLKISIHKSRTDIVITKTIWGFKKPP
jgi:hypothetical protein